MIERGMLILQSWAIVAKRINSKLEKLTNAEILIKSIKVENENEKIKS